MRRLGLSTLVLAAACSLLQAEPPAIEQARKALSEHIPQVAVYKLRRFLDAPSLPSEEQIAARHLLAEALLDGGQVEEAAEAARKLPANAENAVLRASVAAALGQWEDALRIYREGSGLQAQVGEVEALHALNRDVEAVALLEKLVRGGAGANPLRLRLASLLTEVKRLPEAQEIINKLRPISPDERRWKLYVEARILLAEGYADSARRGFEQVLEDGEGLPDSLRFGATLGLTEALIVLKGHEEADKELETFIWRYPQSAYLGRAFQRLDQIYQEQEDPQEEQLHKWAQKPETERAALAQYYVCRLQVRLEKYDKAATSLDYFVKSFSSHPLLCEVHLMQADIHLAQNQFPLAVTALEAAMRQVKSNELRAEIELRTGLAHFQQGEYLLAANLFRTAADGSERLRSVATFNAALAWLNQGNEDRFGEELRRLGDEEREQRLKSELLLEQGLLQARQSDRRAEDSLQIFLRRFPRHSREAEARLALAEIAFWKLRASAVPPRGGAEHAEQLLRVANAAPQTPQTEENAEYLAIFVADARQPRDDAEVIQLAKDFLTARPDSALAPDVQMKLGQVYYRQKDFANAETQFIQLTEKSPKSAYAESALFLAGQCAMELRAEDRALAYFK
ncbi:MAG: tetratricopeptide repeat protein, partial [Chthoniobacteraceae bacterium]